MALGKKLSLTSRKAPDTDCLKHFYIQFIAHV